MTESEEQGLSAVAGPRAATVKNPDVMAPLIQIIDELRDVSRTASRNDLRGRLGMVRARVADTRVRLVVVGPPKSGTSTLVNTMAGAPISATDSAISVPAIVEYGPEPTATLIRREGGGRIRRQLVDPLDPGPALMAKGVIRADFTQPSPLLAEGIVLMDAPGAALQDRSTWSMIAAADAVLYVTDADTEYSREQIAHLRRVGQVCPTVICVLNKIDRNAHWTHVQERNRELLDDAGLAFAVAPVSAAIHQEAQQSGNQQRAIESGLPQLVEHLREYVVAQADATAVKSAVRDIQLVGDHLGVTLRTEADALRDPRRRAHVTQQLATARDQADQLRQRTATWQITLADGSAELMADIEHDLRHRLRTLVRDAEAEIMRTDPQRRWPEFGAEWEARSVEAIAENFELANYRAEELADQVSARFPADHRTPDLPDIRPAYPSELLEDVAPLESLQTTRAGALDQFLSALRGSYGGILMVGMATSLLDMPLVNWYSIGAGLLLGIHVLWEDRRGRKLRRQAEAKAALARWMEDVIFQVGKESRTRLREVQRVLRDHFTDIATDALRAADEALRVAEEAGAQYGDRGAERLARLDSDMGKLRDLRQQAGSIVAA
ncbi:GTPase [Nocardia jinanensis]|uniref:Isoniazid-inducible protein iniA n=1 Tax=Nocardia jinanensis TaxID=382504 RepID=A0A917RV88_9NOCA|nr:GTPase [Nocardia jinanensis]GGL35080.1 isoniazid-inducible protein iniA [Nocardia jinanensis]